MALRKTHGANRRQLIIQFLGEAVLTALLSLLIALALVEVLQPTLARLLQHKIASHYDAGWLFLLVLVAIAAGLVNCLTLARKHLFQRFADGFVWLGGQLCLKTANIACKTQSACSCAIVFCMMTFPDVTSKKGEFGINFCTFAAGSRSRFGLPLPLQSPEFPDSPRKDGSWSQCIDRPSEL